MKAPTHIEEAVGLARQVIGGGHVDVNGSNEGVRGDANTVAQGLMLTCAHERRPGLQAATPTP